MKPLTSAVLSILYLLRERELANVIIRMKNVLFTSSMGVWEGNVIGRFAGFRCSNVEVSHRLTIKHALLTHYAYNYSN